MGYLLPRYKKAVIEDIVNSISSNASYYYAFVSNPVPTISGEADPITTDEYTTIFNSDWNMIFGKRITNNDILPVIKNISWNSNTVYDIYNNRDENLYEKNYYVVCDPDVIGGSHNVFMCLDNANNSPSTIKPTTVQNTSFKNNDGYTWRYVASISDALYKKFSANGYSPIYANTTLSLDAPYYSGIDVVVVANGGTDYRAYTNGTILSNPQANILQISTIDSQSNNGIYTNCGIYVYTTGYNTAELKTVTDYIVNASGRWISVEGNGVNTNNIIPGVTEYIISPRVVFESDGDEDPIAYSVVNNQTNAISSIVVTSPGFNISRANVSILPARYGSGANLYPIAPPPGGYGFDPISELNVKGFSVSFVFNTNENNTIPIDLTYNRIGLLKNPYAANTETGEKTIQPYAIQTFNQLLKTHMSPAVTYSIGDKVIGQNSSAMGVVSYINTGSRILYGTISSSGTLVTGTGTAFTTDFVIGDQITANSVTRTVTIINTDTSLVVDTSWPTDLSGEYYQGTGSILYLVGDKNFTNNETISSNTGVSTSISITDRGKVYTKDIEPLYIQNISNVLRSNNQSESYKLIVQI